ncbi:MAG: ParA family protein [Synergistaceae bacterium]|nr:ParA family protein [Synergistaceae bacterium]
MKSNPLITTVWNYKGGVGKSTISLIIAEIAAQKGLHVLAVDLDAQATLAHTLSLSAKLFPRIEIKNALPSHDVCMKYDIIVIDTHQSTDRATADALAFADIVVIPIYADYNSLINLRSAWDFVNSVKNNSAHVALVKNCITTLKLTADVEETLDIQGYPIAGRLPRSNIIMKNIALGLQWDKSMRDVQKMKFIELFNNVTRLKHV